MTEYLIAESTRRMAYSFFKVWIDNEFPSLILDSESRLQALALWNEYVSV